MSEIDIPLPSPSGKTFYKARVLDIYADDPATWLYEHKDGWQFLVHVYADGTSDLSMRPNSSAIWSPPLEGEKR